MILLLVKGIFRNSIVCVRTCVCVCIFIINLFYKLVYNLSRKARKVQVQINCTYFLHSSHPPH